MTTPIENFVHEWVRSAPGDPRVLLLLHGTGGDEFDLIPLAKELDPDASVLSPRGRVKEGGANRFFRRHAEGVFDLQNMAEESAALAEFLRDASEKYEFKLEDLVALGFSNGANMAASLMMRHPDVVSRAILIRAMVPFVPDSPPNLTGKRVLLLNGGHDPLAPISNAESLASLFRDNGAEVEHHILDTGHKLVREDIRLAKSWLDTQ